jgi:hypothetical protein
MRPVNTRASAATECLDALRLTRDSVRLKAAPTSELASAAAACAKALVGVAVLPEELKQRASTFHVIERAERLLEREMRRRGPNKDH